MTANTGAVLTASEIEARCRASIRGKPLMKDWSPESLRGAKYDLRMADTGMVLPDGRVITPHDDAHRTAILLNPGETIFVSTRERFHMPLDLVGNMSIKGDLSRNGVLSLTGLIVDPGYHDGPSKDGRLHFRLANLGARTIVLNPGRTAIASIQFLRLTGRAEPDPQLYEDVWANVHELREGLGFIDELGRIRAAVDALHTDFENQRRSVDYVVAAAVFLLLATMLGVAVAGLLSLGADSKLIKSAKNIIPNDRPGQVLFVLGLFGVAAIIGAFLFASVRRRRLGLPDLEDTRRVEWREAYRALAVRRGKWVALGAASGTLVTWVCVAIASSLGAIGSVEVLVGVVAGCVSLALLLWLCWRPITRRQVNDLLSRWYSERA